MYVFTAFIYLFINLFLMMSFFCPPQPTSKIESIPYQSHIDKDEIKGNFGHTFYVLVAFFRTQNNTIKFHFVPYCFFSFNHSFLKFIPVNKAVFFFILVL